MVSNFLINKFIKNNSDVTNEKVRNSYGMLGGIVGIFVNVILFATKLSIGLITASISITADAFNNISDAASSIITILGFKLSSKPADNEHPFGHGRIEYLSALIVAFMVMLVGIQLLKTSFSKIKDPEAVTFELIPLILLIISVFLKVWLSRFNKNIGERINSSALKASSIDALGDVFASTCVAISFLAAKFVSFPIDGYMGAGVAIFIIYSGFSLVKDTINPLLGEAPDPELVKSINKKILEYDNILGSHDLIIHNYGPGRCMASIHAEIPSDISVVDIHEIIDQAEREISSSLNVYLVIHIDPICIIEGEVKDAYDEIQKIVAECDYIDSIHDFRVIGHGDKKNLIFDMVINTQVKNNKSDDEIINHVRSQIKKLHPSYNCDITLDKHYT